MSPVGASQEVGGFERLVERHGAGVLRLCRAVLRDEHLGADAAQETFLRLWRRGRGGDAPREPGAWLRRVALRVSLDHDRRRRARDEARRSAGEASDEGAASERDEPLSALAVAELEERLERALERLPEGQRTIFRLRHHAGLRLGEVAELLGVAPSTVKTQFARACTRLQATLSEYDDRGADAT